MSKEWKIVKIIDDYRVVINGGKKDNLQRGDKLEVFAVGEEIFDPETNESLGTLDFIKAYLTVADVFEKMAVCKNAESKSVNLALPISQLEIYKPNRLKVDPSEITGTAVQHDKTIRIGDLVRKA